MMSILYALVHIHLSILFALIRLLLVLALDPSIKLEYAKNNWDSESYHAGYMAFKKVV